MTPELESARAVSIPFDDTATTDAIGEPSVTELANGNVLVVLGRAERHRLRGRDQRRACSSRTARRSTSTSTSTAAASPTRTSSHRALERQFRRQLRLRLVRDVPALHPGRRPDRRRPHHERGHRRDPARRPAHRARRPAASRRSGPTAARARSRDASTRTTARRATGELALGFTSGGSQPAVQGSPTGISHWSTATPPGMKGGRDGGRDQPAGCSMRTAATCSARPSRSMRPPASTSPIPTSPCCRTASSWSLDQPDQRDERRHHGPAVRPGFALARRRHRGGRRIRHHQPETNDPCRRVRLRTAGRFVDRLAGLRSPRTARRAASPARVSGRVPPQPGRRPARPDRGRRLRDVILGGKGADTLDGGLNDDSLSGGEGSDRHRRRRRRRAPGRRARRSHRGRRRRRHHFHAPPVRRAASPTAWARHGGDGDDRIFGAAGADDLDGDNDTIGADDRSAAATANDLISRRQRPGHPAGARETTVSSAAARDRSDPGRQPAERRRR